MPTNLPGGESYTDYFIETDGTVWNNTSIDANDQTKGIPTGGFDITLYFLSDSNGTLTIDTQEKDGDWQTYDTISITANDLSIYTLSARTRRIRLSFDTAATITAWYQKG